MKIGLLINEVDIYGGIQKNYLSWFYLFKKHNIETFLFVVDKPKKTFIKDENIIFLKGFSIFDKGLYLRNKIKQLGKFDLFLVNAEYMKAFIPNDYYITVHNTWEIKNRKGLKKFFFLQRMKQKYKNEKLIGISKSVLDNITDNLKIPVKSKTVIYAPHNIEKVRNLANENINKRNFIVSVGALIKRKRHDLTIKAFNQIKNNTNKNLVIIGEGSEKENLEKLINSLNLQNRIKLLGFKENPYPYIKNASLLVLSSDSEGLPRVVVESLILHTPVVATYSSEGINEVMIDELQNFIVPKNNENILAQKILSALKAYPQITEKYYKKFDENESFKKFMELAK